MLPEPPPLFFDSRKNGKVVRLEAQQVALIEEALAAAGEFGEVHLIVEKGRLRFVVVQRSFDALKTKPGQLGG